MVGLKPVDSFITVFIQRNVGLENKLIRVPLLGLAKSIYYSRAFKDLVGIRLSELINYVNFVKILWRFLCTLQK